MFSRARPGYIHANVYIMRALTRARGEIKAGGKKNAIPLAYCAALAVLPFYFFFARVAPFVLVVVRFSIYTPGKSFRVKASLSRASSCI